MERISIHLSPESEFALDLKDFPGLTSGNKLVNKGIELLKHYTPGVLRYLSQQKVMAHLPDVPDRNTRRRGL